MEGFQNLGNTCYINAALQSLFSIDIFCEHLKQYDCNNPFIETLKDLLLLQQDRRNELLKTFLILYKKKYPGHTHAPEDAVEVIIRIIDEYCDDTMITMMTNEDCPCNEKQRTIKNMFTGVCSVTTVFQCCGTTRHLFEHFTILPLYKSDICQVMNERESLHWIDNVQCDKCHINNAVTQQQYGIHLFPSVMILEVLCQEGGVQLIETLFVNHKHGNNNHSIFRYILKSIIIYHGSHYTCIVRKNEQSWILTDDTRLIEINDIEPFYKYIRCLCYEKLVQNTNKKNKFVS
jgi:ubiquitin C-terminal hydrolase